MSTRVASHAGSWYESRGSVLSAQLQGWLGEAKQVQPETDQPVRAIIAPSVQQPPILRVLPSHRVISLRLLLTRCPFCCGLFSHAGYSYSGPTAAYAYKHLNAASVRRVFILGPSHHHYTKQAELSAHSTYATPIAPLTVDTAVIAELKRAAPALFSSMSASVDEDEHSLEMHLPYLAHVLQAAPSPPTVVPILVGSLSASTEAALAAVLLPYFLSPSSFFVVSSDFCHWGSRFSYTHWERAHGRIHQSIEALDREGMALIQRVDCKGWAAYLKEKKNTICGRHPIGVLLQLMDAAQRSRGERVAVTWVRYAQSSAVERTSDSSVSYASAVITVQPKSAGGPQEGKAAADD